MVVSFVLSLLCAAFRYRLYVAEAGVSNELITERQLQVPFLTVIPALSYVFPWSFLTASFVQQNLFSVFS